MSTGVRRLGVALSAAGAALALLAGSGVASAASEHGLSVEAAASRVSVTGWDGQIPLSLGLWVANRGTTSFAVRVGRAQGYDDPITAEIRFGHRRTAVPDTIPTTFAGFTRFAHVTVTDRNGAVVYEQDLMFCPNGFSRARLSPTARDASSYPDGCFAFNPFTLGSVWGIDPGWAVALSTDGGFTGTGGVYRAHVELDTALADLLGIPRAARVVDVTLDVTMISSIPFPVDDPGPRSVAPVEPAASSSSRARPLPRLPRITAATQVPRAALPNLVALPAWSMQTESQGGRDYLDFAANVWNAGRGVLSVEGYRSSGTDVMDAFQFFYRDGRAVGYVPTGTLEFDRRPGHEHWHFTDFARYELVSTEGTEAVRSQKEAFCIAPTDAIDLRVPGADYFPGNGDLRTACGDSTALWIRETLPSAWGDTYYQFVPGQSFDITNLQNGTYYVHVIANPDRRLLERTLVDNESTRLVILDGPPGARTVTVPPYMGIDTETPPGGPQGPDTGPRALGAAG
jgi:hypothetical protein